MPYVGSEPRYDNNVEPSKKYVHNDEKTSISKNSTKSYLEASQDYAVNKEKTTFELDGDTDILVSGWNCNPYNIQEKFEECRINYNNNLINRGINPETIDYGLRRDGTAKRARAFYHMIMSFPELDDLSPRLVHQIGLEFCEKFFGDNRMATVSTHMNTKCLHNHLLFSAYDIDGLHKYRDTMEMLWQAREISNELSQKYGIEIMVRDELEPGKTKSWYETQQEKNNNSWKANLKEAIIENADNSKSWEEFKTNMLEDGWDVIARGKENITYKDLKSEKHVRSKNLGEEFTKPYIIKKYGYEDISQEEYAKRKATIYSSVPQNKNNNEDSLYKTPYTRYGTTGPICVPRYTPTGRRRSDLELLFLGMQQLLNMNKDRKYAPKDIAKDANNLNYSSIPAKLRAAQKLQIYSQDVEKHFEVSTTVEAERLVLATIKKFKNEVGMEKNILEKDLKSIDTEFTAFDKIKDDIEKVHKLQEDLRAKGVDVDNLELYLLSYDPEEERKNYAKNFSMLPSQRFEFYNKLDKKGYVILFDKDEVEFKEALSYKEAQAAIDFLDGKTSVKPDFIVTKSEKNKINGGKAICNQHLEYKKNNLVDKPVSEEQNKIIEQIKKEHPEAEYTPQNAYEAFRFINFYTNTNLIEAPLAEAKAVKDIEKKLKGVLSEEGLTLSLARNTMTEKEVKEIASWLENPTKDLPSNVISSKESHLQRGLTSSETKTLEKMLIAKRVNLPISIEELTLKDYYKLRDYLGCKNDIPDFIKESNDQAVSRVNERFYQLYKDNENFDEIQSLRATINALAREGFTADKYTDTLLRYEELRAKKDSISSKIHSLSKEYRDLSLQEHALKNKTDNVFLQNFAGYVDPKKIEENDKKLEAAMEATNVVTEAVSNGNKSMDDISGDYSEEGRKVVASAIAKLLNNDFFKAVIENGIAELFNLTDKDYSSTISGKAITIPGGESLKFEKGDPIYDYLVNNDNLPDVKEIKPEPIVKEEKKSVDNKPTETKPVEATAKTETSETPVTTSKASEEQKSDVKVESTVKTETKSAVEEKKVSEVIPADSKPVEKKTATVSTTTPADTKQELAIEATKAEAKNKVTAETPEPVQQPTPAVSKEKKNAEYTKFYDKDNIQGFLSEDGLAIILNNQQEQDICINGRELIHAGHHRRINCQSRENANEIIENLINGEITIDKYYTEKQIPDVIMKHAQKLNKITGTCSCWHTTVLNNLNEGYTINQIVNFLKANFECYSQKDFDSDFYAKFSEINENKLEVTLVNDSGRDINVKLCESYITLKAGESLTFNEEQPEFAFIADIDEKDLDYIFEGPEVLVTPKPVSASTPELESEPIEEETTLLYEFQNVEYTYNKKLNELYIDNINNMEIGIKVPSKSGAPATITMEPYESTTIPIELVPDIDLDGLKEHGPLHLLCEYKKKKAEVYIGADVIEFLSKDGLENHVGVFEVSIGSDMEDILTILTDHKIGKIPELEDYIWTKTLSIEELKTDFGDDVVEKIKDGGIIDTDLLNDDMYRKYNDVRRARAEKSSDGKSMEEVINEMQGNNTEQEIYNELRNRGERHIDINAAMRKAGIIKYNETISEYGIRSTHFDD